jgi:hypothetical protein
MKQFILSLFLWCCLARFANAEIASTAKIILSGHTREGAEAFVIEATVKNNSSCPVFIAMMSSGLSGSWRIDPEAEFAIPSLEGYERSVSSCEFAAGGGYLFNFLVVSSDVAGKAEGKKLKLGFICRQSRSDQNSPISWTNPLIVPKISDGVLAVVERRKKLSSQMPDTTARSSHGAP